MVKEKSIFIWGNVLSQENNVFNDDLNFFYKCEKDITKNVPRNVRMFTNVHNNESKFGRIAHLKF